MLDVMRKHSRSFIIYVFFGIIIAVFVVNFGPQSAGCAASTSYAGKVAGKALTLGDFSYAQSVWGLKAQSGSEEQLIAMRAMVMDKLIARELLAKDALALGFEIPGDEIEDMIVDGRFIALGDPRPLIRGDSGQFDYDLFSRYARYYWGVTVKKFKDYQRIELLADKMRQLLRSLVKVSEDEVQADYIQRNTQVNVQYVRFSPEAFENQAGTDPAKLKAFIADHAKEIKAHFESNKNSYKKVPPQLKLQVLALSWNDEEKKARVQAKAQRLLASLRGGADFAQLARRESDDASKADGGNLGWRDANHPGLGKIDAATLAALDKGKVSDLLEDEGRFLIAKVLDKREGDLGFEQVKDEIARKLFRDQAAERLRKAAVERALARIKAGEQLSQIFPDDDASPASRPADLGPAGAPNDRLKLAATGFFSRTAEHLVPRIGISDEIATAVFKLKKGETADKPFTVGRMTYLVAVTDRKDPDMKEWETDREDKIANYTALKAAEVVRAYTHSRCEEARQKDEISVSASVLVTPGYLEQQRKAGKAPTLPAYEPCRTLAPSPSMFY